MLRVFVGFFACLLLSRAGWAEHFRIPIASDDDLYVGEILKFILEAEGGGHTAEILRIEPVAQGRALRALEDGRADYDMIYSAYSAEREKRLIMVRFPLTRGMLGYRLLAVRQDRVGKLSPDMGFGSLQSSVCFGAGTDWPDTEIMRRAGLCVVTGNDENLWPMLARGRYDAFPRGLIEVMAELKRTAKEYRGVSLTLDPAVMLAYRQDLFFFLSKRDQARANIIETGLAKTHADGSYDRFLYNVPAIREALQELQRHPRTTFHLGSPSNSAALATVPDQYWYNYDDASAVAQFLEDGTKAGAP